MDSFAKRHPLVILSYYIIALMTLLVVGDPWLFVITAGLMFFVRFLQIGGHQSLRSLMYSIGAIVLCLLINPLLNHRGVTLLITIGDMRITKEAVCYGGHMALLLVTSLFLFSCFSYYMTAEKIMALMGKRCPSFSMLFTMILRVVPKVRKDIREITELHGNRPKVWYDIFPLFTWQTSLGGNGVCISFIWEFPFGYEERRSVNGSCGSEKLPILLSTTNKACHIP